MPSNPLLSITLPLRWRSHNKKRTILYSLNNFLLPLMSKTFSTFYHARAKRDLINYITGLCAGLSPIDTSQYPVQLKLTVNRANNRRMDVGNFTLLEKYTTDVLVKQRIIPDDSHKYIYRVILEDGGLQSEEGCIYEIFPKD